MAYIKLAFEDVGEASSFQREGGSYLVRATQPNGLTAIVYTAVLNEDIDGAPNCYARFNPASPHGLNGGLDRLRSATNHGSTADFTPLPKGVAHHDWRWVGVLHRSHREAVAEGILNLLDERPELAALNENRDPAADPQFPVLRDDNDRFYVSTTSLTRSTAAAVTNPAHWWDASTVAYGANTPPLVDLGVGLGDFGIAIRRDNGTASPFFFADSGNGNKVGEMSRSLVGTLFPRGQNQEEKLVSFIVFPGSHTTPIANTPRPTLRTRLTELSTAANVDTMIGLMASGAPFRGLPADEQVYILDDVRHFRTHRAPDLDVGRGPANIGSTRYQTIANALRTFGFDPVVAGAAAAEAAAAERPGLKIEPMNIGNIPIPPPPGS
jgi:hypothetical protein